MSLLAANEADHKEHHSVVLVPWAVLIQKMYNKTAESMTSTIFSYVNENQYL
jgi:hypothetical protein